MKRGGLMKGLKISDELLHKLLKEFSIDSLIQKFQIIHSCKLGKHQVIYAIAIFLNHFRELGLV